MAQRRTRRVLARATTALFAVALGVVACGGHQQPPPTTGWIERALPPSDELAEWARESPTDGADALLRSYALDALGEHDAALRLAVDAAPPEPNPWSLWFEVGRALRVGEHRFVAPSFDEIVSGAAESERVGSLGPALLWGELRALVEHRRHRHGMDDSELNLAPAGASARWRVLGPVSSADVLDFDREFPVEREPRLPERVELESGPLRSVLVRSTGSTFALPDRDAGIYFAESFVTVDRAGTYGVLVSSAAGYRATISGVVVAARDPSHPYDPQMDVNGVSLSEGTHRVLVRVGSPGGGSQVTVQLAPLDGGTIIAFEPDVVPSTERGRVTVERADAGVRVHAKQNTLGAFVAIDFAVAWGDPVFAEVVYTEVMKVAGDPVTLFHAARLPAAMFHIPPSTRSDLTIAALTRAAEFEFAAGARIQLARELIAAGQLDAAEPLIAELVASQLDHFQAQSVAADFYRERGWSELERAARRRAVRLYPRHCATVARVLDGMREVGDPISPETVAEEWLACDATQRLLVTEYLLPRGDFAAAARVVRTLVSRQPDNLRYATMLADIEAALDGARAHESTYDQYTTDIRPMQRLAADNALARSDPDAALEAFERVFAHGPAGVGDRLAADFAFGETPFEGLIPDGRAVVAEFLESGATYDGGIVYVRDFGAVFIYRDGTAIEVVHQIVRLQSREALGEYGEIGVPHDATLLRVQTLKPDGRALVPDAIAGKDSISMPALERGDFIELAWVSPMYGPARELPALRTGRFFFQTFDGAMHHSEVVYSVEEGEPEPLFELRAFDGERTRETSDGWVHHRFRSRPQTAAVRDPRDVDPTEWLPSVRAGRHYSWSLIERMYGDALEPLTAATLSIEDGVEQLLESARDDRERVRRVFRFVSDEVSDLGRFFSTPASWTWESREGERLPLLIAMLRVAGYDPDVVFVRPIEQDHGDVLIPDIAPFDLTAVRVPTSAGDIWLEPDFERYPFDYLRADAQGCEAFVVAGPNAGEVVVTPMWPVDDLRARIVLVAHVDESGNATIALDEQLPPRLASGFRLFMQSAEDRRLVERQLEGALGSSFAGVDAVEITFEGLDDPDASMMIRYRFESRGFARRVGDELVFDGELLPRPIAGWYAGSATREVDMLVSIPLIETLQLTVHPPAGWSVTTSSTSERGDWRTVSWERSYRVRDGALHAERRIDLPVQRVEAAAYSELAPVLRAFEAGERTRIVFRRDDLRR